MAETSPKIGSTWKSDWNIPQYRFYLPAALAVPPSQFLVHSQFVFLFQVWSFCLSLSGLEIFKGIHPELDVRNSYIVNFTQLHLSTYSSVLDSLGANRWHRPSWTYFQHVHISPGDLIPWESKELFNHVAMETLVSKAVLLLTFSEPQVHHGSNRYCLDKNYGGFLSVRCVHVLSFPTINHVSQIWDRIFGTFQDLRPDEQTV